MSEPCRKRAREDREDSETKEPSFDELVDAASRVLKEDGEMNHKKVLKTLKQQLPRWRITDKKLHKAIMHIRSAPKEVKEQVHLNTEGRLMGTPKGFNYDFKAIDAIDLSDKMILKKLVGECEKAYKKKSFWLAANAKPRFTLEALAKQIFEFHTADVKGYDETRSGAEWWVQFRGTKSAHGKSIGFHWDRDEFYADRTDQNVHPQIGTVTYLSEHGAPTLVLDQSPIPKGESRDIHSGALSHPKLGKHICFDGRFLHGVPAELSRHLKEDQFTRITFLVNIWISHIPTDTAPWPEEDVKSMSTFSLPVSFSQILLRSPTAVTVDHKCPVQGFAFGRKGESHELWLPTPRGGGSPDDNMVIRLQSELDSTLSQVLTFTSKAPARLVRSMK